MKNNLLTSFLMALGLFLVSGPIFAHHGDAGRYAETVTTVTGTVVEFQFINPHAMIFIDVKDENGKVERWQGELGGPNTLSRGFGWTKNTLKPGDKITMIGRRLKNGSNYIGLNEMSKVIATDSGKELFHGGGGGGAPQQAPY